MFIDRTIPFVIQLDILCLRLLNFAGFDFENIFIGLVIDSSIILLFIFGSAVGSFVNSSKSLSSLSFFFMLMMSKGDSLGIAS